MKKPLNGSPASIACALSAVLVFAFAAPAQEASITIHADQVLHRVTRQLTGACIEDVNHEIYGGIDSQMIFGESFAEPAPQPELKGFKAYGGSWAPQEHGSLIASGGDGPKLVSDGPVIEDGEVSVELQFTNRVSGNAGLILRVSQAATGADRFNGYEVSLEPAGNLVIGRHRQNWESLLRVPCEVPLNEWVTLSVRMQGALLQVLVNGKNVAHHLDSGQALLSGQLGVRTWQTGALFRNLSVSSEAAPRMLPFAYENNDLWGNCVSGMWKPFRSGTAQASFELVKSNVFVGRQSQSITFSGGEGQIGIENQSLNRWGMNFVRGKPYEGYLWAKTAAATELFVALESGDGSKVYSEKKLKLRADDWNRVDFTLKPNAADPAGRFAIKLNQPASVTLGYAFLQPGDWGRFKGLPVRKDVAEGLIQQGITTLRLGGCMANAREYRWKNMIGPRAQRPPYAGWWYPYSSNGWGIFDFLNFCEAAGFLGIPDVNIDETPQDMADFIEYVNGPASSTWGRKRAQDGHPKPYGLKHLQIGNEERVNDEYWQKFKPLAEAIWAKDPEIILVVGDFAYHQKIIDPFDFRGADGRITTLAAQQKILSLAKEHHREVWFDVHVWTEGPHPSYEGTQSYVNALETIADGAKHRVVIFEFNANNHAQRRALANAIGINVAERDGRFPVVLSANCLQPDGQNDNGWDQGLLFLNPSKVWLQPPGYVTKLFSRHYQPLVVKCTVEGGGQSLHVNVKRSEDNSTLVVQAVNVSDKAVPARIVIQGFVPRKADVKVEVLSGAIDAVNTAAAPDNVATRSSLWRHAVNENPKFNFEPQSVTFLRFE